jgi:hypothetical protein
MVGAARHQGDSRDEIAPISSPLPSDPFGVRWLPLPARGHQAGCALVLRFGLSYRDVEELSALTCEV